MTARTRHLVSIPPVDPCLEETAALAQATGGQLDMHHQGELAKQYSIEFIL